MVKLKKLFWTVLILTIFVNLMAAIPVYAANPAVSLGALTINAYGVGTATFSITSNGGCAITDCGIDYGTSPSNLNQCANLEAQPVGTHTVTLTGLSAGTIYYYRAYAVNANGGWVQSTVKSAVLPGSFDIKSPAKDSTVAYNSNVTVSWDTSKNASKYYLHLRDITAGESTSTVIYSGTSTSHKISSSKLSAGHKYKISVKAEASLSGNICEMWDTDSETGYYFYVANKPANPGSFSIKSPENNLCFMPDEAVTVSWGESSNAVQYVLSYADVTSGGSNVVLYTGSSLSYTISASKFNPGHKYKFILKARSVSGSDLYVTNATNSGSCYIWRRPGYFEISEPDNGEAIRTNTSVTVRWKDSAGAVGYRLHIKDISVTSSITDIISVGTDTYYDIPANTLTDGHEYKIHVEALSASGIDDNSSWSTNSNAKYTFVYHANISKPGAFNIEFPDNNLAFMPDEDAVIRWTASKNAVEYKISMRDITSGEKNPTEIYVGSETSHTIPESQLIDGHQYKIQVCARSVAGTDEGGTWATDADDYYFWVKPGYFHIEAPANNAIMTPENNVVVKWTESLNASGYILNIRDLSVEGATTQKIDVGKDTMRVFEPGSLVRGHKYKIHVQSWVNKIDDDYSTWSSNSDIMYSFVYGEASDAKVISATVNPTTMAVGEKAKFTVRTNKETNKIIMCTESGAVADEWSGSSYYTDSGSERIWSFERIIYSVGKRFLTFKASDGTAVNDNSSATVSLNVEAAGGKITTTITSKKEYNTTIGGTYEASWSSDRSARSYNLLLYYNGNLIRTIKDYKYTYYKMGYAMFLTPGEYTLEVIPYYPGYEAIGDAATIYVSSDEVTAATIDSVDAPDEVVCNVDDFECTVVTSTGTTRVVLEPEVGMYLDFTLVSSGSKTKTWKFTKKINYIGKRKLTVRAFDNDGGEATPYQLNLNVIPEDIDWNIAYDEASGELTVSASDSLTTKLEGAYARLVVYKNGSSKNLMENSGELALINKASKKSRTWNVFTDLNLTAGETYTFAVSYLSTYAQGYGCGAIVETIGSKTLSDTEEELPEIYSVDMEMDNTDEAGLMSFGEVGTVIGDSARFILTTNSVATEIYMVDANNVNNNNALIKLDASCSDFVTFKSWKIKHRFTSLHAERPIKFLAKDDKGNMSTIHTLKKELTVGFPENAWSGSVKQNDTGNRVLLSIKQSDSIKNYNSNNKYYLWIKETGKDVFTYYHTMNDRKITLAKQDANGCIVHMFDMENELSLKPYTAYEYGVSGKSTYCDALNVSTVDYKIGDFTTGDLTIDENAYINKYVEYKGDEGLYVYRSPYNNEVNWARDQDGNPITLKYAQPVMCDDIGSYTEGLGEEWIKIKCENYINGIKFDTAYVRKEFLSDKPLYQFIWPTLSTVNKITSGFGRRISPITGNEEGHTGVDIAGAGCNNTPIFATASGTVIKKAFNLYYVNGKAKGYGHYIVIDHGGGYSSLYAHMIQESPLEKDSNVNIGDEIGRIGTTGGSTGPHLHFEIRKNGSYIDPLPYIAGHYLTPGEPSSIELMSIEPQLTYEIVCYNKYGEIIATNSFDSNNASTINIPYSTEYISFVAIPSSSFDSVIVSHNGEIIEGAETFTLSKSESATVNVVYVDEETNEQKTYIVALEREDAQSGNTLNSVFVVDNERESGGDIPCYNVDISDNMTITLPKSISEIGLALETDNPYASIRVFKNGYYWIDKDVILLDDTTNELTIVVENELGEEKEYTLIINKKSEYESDTTLEFLNIFAYDSVGEYLDVYTFDSTVNEITGLSEDAKTVMIGASIAPDFATVTYYVNGEETIFEEPISLSTGFVLTIRVTAEDGTYKDYTYTYGEPPVALTKTTFKNTATYHKFYVTFEEAIDNATIYAAIYDKDGKLLGVKESPCDGDDYYIVNVPFNSNTNSAKIFLWADDIKPLGKEEILNMK